MPDGIWWTTWTIRAALAAYVIALVVEASSRKDRPRLPRILHSVGMVLLWVHIGFAFHVFHGWSHATAWQHTAQRTREVTGIAAGWGLYLNYLYGVLWTADVGLLWTRTRWTRSRWRVALHLYLLFVAVNSTVVFESGAIRWAGVVSIAVLAGVWLRRCLRTKDD